MACEFDDITFTGLGEGQAEFSLFVEFSALTNNIAYDIEFGRLELANSFLEAIIRVAEKKGVDLGDRVDRIRRAMHTKMYEFSLSYARQYFEYGIKPLARAWLDDAKKYAELLGIDESRVNAMEQYYERIGA